MTMGADQHIQDNEPHNVTEKRMTLMSALLDMKVPKEVYYFTEDRSKQAMVLMRYAYWFLQEVYNTYAVRRRSKRVE